MKDLSLHVLDVLENAAAAGAAAVRIQVSGCGTRLSLEIGDDGPGFPESVRPDPTDPYRTTRTDRAVGLGLGFLHEAATRTGGSLDLATAPEGGVLVRACFDLGHCDAQPLGPLEDALCAAMVAWPAMDLVVRVGPDMQEVLNTKEVKAVLDGVEISSTAVQAALRSHLREALAPLHDWAARCGDGSPGEAST